MRHDEPTGSLSLPPAVGIDGTAPTSPPVPIAAPAPVTSLVEDSRAPPPDRPAAVHRRARSRPRPGAVTEPAGAPGSKAPDGSAPTAVAARRESRRAELPDEDGPERGEDRAGSAPPRRTRWPIFLAAAAVPLAAGTAYVAAALGEPLYAARSEVVFHLRDLGADAAARFLATQALTAQSRIVLEPVAARLGVPAGVLDEQLSVEVLPGSNVMRLEHAHRDGAVALATVQDVTGRYLTLLRDVEMIEEASHRLLTPAFVLDEPVAPRPLRAAALGALVGLALVAGVLVARQA